MSIFIPYDLSKIVEYFSTNFNLELSSLDNFQQFCVILFSNLYFFTFWFFVIYFALKLFNRIYYKLF